MKSLIIMNLFFSLCYATSYLSTQQRVFHAKAKKTRKISDKYRIGSSLIYDCEDGHFACVSKEDGENCEQKYKDDYALRKLSYRCRFIKIYEESEECDKKHETFMERQKEDVIDKLCNPPR